MKKMKIVGMLLVLVLVVAGCSAGNQKETAEKETMKKADMTVESTAKEMEMKDEAVPEADKMDDKESPKCIGCGADVEHEGEYCEACQIKIDGMNKEDGMKEETMNKDDGMKEETMKKDSEMKEEAETMVKETNKGRMAEKFELVDLVGKSHSLEGYAGEKVYVKFWASWCPICLSGLQELDDLAASDPGFKVLTVVTPGKNGEKNTEEFKEWFEGLGYNNITVLLDEDAKTTMKYGVRGYPTSAYIGSDGVLVKTLPGHNGNDAIKGSFDEIH